MWPFHPEAKPGTYPPLPLIEGDQVVKLGLDHADQEQLTTQYTMRAVEFIERNKDRPFFFYLAHNMPHVPLHVSDKFRGKSERGLYGDVIMEIDWSVGEVMRTVERLGLSEKTLIIFASDNGPWLSYGDHAGRADPLREGKGTCWEGGTRVPCIMRWPGQLPAGTKSADMICSIDLFPTIAKLTGAKLPEHKLDGLDVWPIIVGPARRHESARWLCILLWRQRVGGGDLGRRALEAATAPHLSHLEWPARRHRRRAGEVREKKIEQAELYDLVADMAEEHNVAEAHPEVVQRLQAFVETMRADLGDALTKRPATGARRPDVVAGAAGARSGTRGLVWQD